MDAVGNIPLIVTFKDGHVEDATSHSGYFANKLDNGTTDAVSYTHLDVYKRQA